MMFLQFKSDRSYHKTSLIGGFEYTISIREFTVRSLKIRELSGSCKIGRASCRERGWMAGVAVASRRRHTRFSRDWSSDVCSSDLIPLFANSILMAPYVVLIL